MPLEHPRQATRPRRPTTGRLRPTSPFADEVPDPGPINLPQARIISTDEVVGEVWEDLLAVHVRTHGRWRPTVLTGWSRLRDGNWAARLQPEHGGLPVWIAQDSHVLQPVQAIDSLTGPTRRD
ncbi:hypothetical protein ACFV4P_34495 [Kitasatospora sp. NPDC059795]|uniref:hypothetical protein n=1 Tax=Kitasatospora sp. NPDC059795 TaxID=3346949 RepID=UPI00366063A8